MALLRVDEHHWASDVSDDIRSKTFASKRAAVSVQCPTDMHQTPDSRLEVEFTRALVKNLSVCSIGKMSKPVLAWLDLEMTGLDPDTCAIVQLAMILTDSELKEVAPPLDLTIWQPESVLGTMSPFVRSMHEKSGLLAGVRTSPVAVADAERAAVELLSRHAPFRTARLCGNSIGQDRRFLVKYMPLLDGYLHYRQIDVSSIKEVAGFWFGTQFEKPDNGKHTALHDVRQSIAELAYYRQNVFRQP